MFSTKVIVQKRQLNCPLNFCSVRVRSVSCFFFLAVILITDGEFKDEHWPRC
ncbi:hypothetical protein PAHAL_1G055900 [Panicum hallii]|uniref:Uncharacterized protein n=1 Tax=Panicum hallii TaxID=206008 RepID=A0A2S3GLP7_9POAL|nr:hypothetical protein PAHAL_1G055900 [Panicum hallii]